MMMRSALTALRSGAPRRAPVLLGAGLSASIGFGAATLHTSPAFAASVSHSGASTARDEAIAAAREVGRNQPFPMIQPFNTGFLSIPTKTPGLVHEIYYEE